MTWCVFGWHGSRLAEGLLTSRFYRARLRQPRPLAVEAGLSPAARRGFSLWPGREHGDSHIPGEVSNGAAPRDHQANSKVRGQPPTFEDGERIASGSDLAFLRP